MKPQSMQAMAPGSKLLPHAGQVVSAAPAALAAASAAATDGKVIAGDEPDAVEAGREDETAAATACRAGTGTPAVNGFLQLTQRNGLPSEPSGSCIAVLQCG